MSYISLLSCMDIVDEKVPNADMREQLKISLEELEKLANDLAPTREKRSDAVADLNELWVKIVGQVAIDANRSASISSTESEKTESRE